MSKIQPSQPLMHTNLFFSYTLLIYLPLSRPHKQEENLFKHKERRHHCILFRHYRLRPNSSNLRRTTHETLDLKRRGGDGRKLTRQALGTLNCNRHHCTIFQLQAPHLLLTGLAGEWCGYVHLLWLRLFDFALTDGELSPSMTNASD